MPESSAELMSHPVEDFLSPVNLDLADATVTEVFKLMFGFDIRIVDLLNLGASACALDERTAIVGFSG